VEEISGIDKTDRKIGGRPRINPLWMIKAIFLQHLFSLSDPQLEDQLIDRLRFQQFVGIHLDHPESVRDTPAHEHDSTQTEALISYDEGALFGDKAYFDNYHKYSARKYGWYYGVLEKPARGQKLSGKQKKRNRKHSRVRASVEHPLAWMKTKAGLTRMRAKNQIRNRLRFVFTCMGWNLSRTAFLRRGTKPLGLVGL